MYEMKRERCYGIGFIDPNTINEETWSYAWYQTEVEKNMLEFLKRLNTNEHIYTTSLQLHVSHTVLYYKLCFCLLATCQ